MATADTEDSYNPSPSIEDLFSNKLLPESTLRKSLSQVWPEVSGASERNTSPETRKGGQAATSTWTIQTDGEKYVENLGVYILSLCPSWSADSG